MEGRGSSGSESTLPIGCLLFLLFFFFCLHLKSELIFRDVLREDREGGASNPSTLHTV